LRRGAAQLWRHCGVLGRGACSQAEFVGGLSLARTGGGWRSSRAWEATGFVPQRHMTTEQQGKDEEPGPDAAREEREGGSAGAESGQGAESAHDAELLATLQGMTTEQLHEHIIEIKKDLDEKERGVAVRIDVAHSLTHSLDARSTLTRFTTRSFVRQELKDRLVRTLADMENLRDRTSKQLEEARKFATQGLVKSLLDVADNLERAASSVLKDVDAAELDVEKALGLLHGLKDGVVMTDGILMRILEKEGVTRYDPAGEEFDPNLHDALFEVPAGGDAKPGTVAVVVKKGYMMHDRAVRAAEVGVVKGE